VLKELKINIIEAIIYLGMYMRVLTKEAFSKQLTNWKKYQMRDMKITLHITKQFWEKIISTSTCLNI
jgi:hypothetical protein